jgi:hypothetical protein
MRLCRFIVLAILIAHTCLIPCAGACLHAVRSHSCCIDLAPPCCHSIAAAVDAADRAELAPALAANAGATTLPTAWRLAASAGITFSLLAPLQRSSANTPLVLRT